jgi:hypothetical protein
MSMKQAETGLQLRFLFCPEQCGLYVSARSKGAFQYEAKPR